VRLNYQKVHPEAIQAMFKFQQFVENTSIEPKLRELIKIRASQLNGCAYCIDMHTKDARKKEESERRINLLSTWRETKLYSEAEQAALALTEAVTRIGDAGLPDGVYDQVLRHFDEKQTVELIMIINSINSWNRISVSFHTDLPE
jgi:AhpD family alkylhydroperoxidase